MATSQDFVNWVCGEALDPDFLMQAFLAEGEHLKKFGKGTTHTTIYFPEVLAFNVALPPLNEQKRIVAKIDALTEKSRRAREALDEVPDLLDKLRQSILAAAFRGDLTRDWREKNPDVEPADKLLERIRTERRARWEQAELAKMRAKGKEPKNKAWKAKYQEPERVDTEGLPELPEGWCWGSIAEIAHPDTVVTYGIVLPKENVPDGVPYIRGQDIQNGQILTDQLLRTSKEIAATHSRSELRTGDVLLCIIRHLKVALVPDGLDGANLTQGTVRIRPSDAVRGPYLSRYLTCPFAQASMLSNHFGLAMPRINVADARAVPVAIAPAKEQSELERILERQLQLVRSLEAVMVGTVDRLQNLDSSVLAKAFRGQLVPQDPIDKPASELIEQIRAERGTTPTRKRRARAEP